jgi:porphobilinogen synthase
MPHFPQTRMRRRRMSEALRSLSRENTLLPSQLILPAFVMEGVDHAEPIASMPRVSRHTIDRLILVAKEAKSLGILALALFPVTPPARKNPRGSEALNADNLVCRALSAVKSAVPELLLIADVALDPYTSHGQDGLINHEGVVMNDPTNEMLCEQAVLQAQAGADMVAPSDMMDGRIGQIRQTLDRASLLDTLILAYTAKYASAYYGPFREAVGSQGSLGKGNKKNYQMDPANGREAILEAALDVSEGADFIMVKPGLPYLDIIRRLADSHSTPVFAYQVSGEYASIHAAGINGWLDAEAAMMEAMLCFRRAGAQCILTYAALDMARALHQGFHRLE